MTETGKMLLKIAVLLVPAIALFATLYTGKSGGGIGGGGYDLSELVYGGLFTLFVAGWNVWVFVALLTARTDLDRQYNKILLTVGILILIPVVIWFVKQLR